MKNDCDEFLEAKIADRNDRAKKLYRYVSDVARRIGESTSTIRSMTDLFSTHIEIQRQKLRDNCEKLLFLDPLNYGKKSLELLWRKVYYDTVSTAKKIRETEDDDISHLFTHMVCGIGNFHNFIDRIQSDMKIQLKELDYAPLYKDEENQDVKDSPCDDELQTYRSIIHSCLIYLGDLSRYQAEIFHTFEPSIAARYYLQAAHIDMSSGMPYNQLGNLYLDKNYNLDSVCFYIHCLGCSIPFEGAMGNLTKIFEKTAQFNDIPNEPETLTQAEHIQNTIVNFLSLIEIWYTGKNDTNIPQRCNTIAQELKICMDLGKSPLPDINKNYHEYIQAVEEENTNPSYLNGNLVHRIVQICLFTIAKMTETDEVKAFACKAFTLALLSQLLQKLHKQLVSIGLENPADKYHPRTALVEEVESKKVEEPIEQVKEVTADIVIVNGNNKIEHDNLSKDNICQEDTEKTNGDIKNNKKALTKRRRRRRINSSDSSDMSDEETESSEVETYESCSDDDVSDSTYHSDDDSQSAGSCDDVSDNDEFIEKKKNGNGKIEVNEIEEKDKPTNGNQVDLNEKHNKPDTDTKVNEINIEELQDFLLGDNVLQSVKLLIDWALSEKNLLLSCGDSGESLFQCVVDLLNIFAYYFGSKIIDIPEDRKEYKIFSFAKNIVKKLRLEFKTIPLPEDIGLRGTNICKFDKHAAEWQILDKYKPSVYEENILRIMNFMEFGYQIAKMIPRIRYNRSMKIFYLKNIPNAKHNSKNNHKRNREWHNTKKPHGETSEGALLRRLGRLWLTSQVRELERSGHAAAPALLALDSASLHKHLRRVKQLLRARNFILLVPTVVVQELDDLKREQSSARDAIRWLELQLRGGSRFLRAQRPGQARPLPLLKYPRKPPSHVLNFIQILEFCNHLIAEEKQTQGGEGDPAGMLVLLVGNEPGEEDRYKEFSVTGAAQSAGISIEYIGDFYARWRRTVHRTSSSAPPAPPAPRNGKR